MRQLLIDELSREERDNIESYLKRTLKRGPIAGIYWLEVPKDLLARPQQGHEGCAPFYFAVELGEDFLRLELLVRSSSILHCTCIAHASPAQREFVCNFAETLLNEERIRA